MNAQDKAAARVLAALSYNLLVGAMDFGDVLEALNRVMDQPEQEKVHYQ